MAVGERENANTITIGNGRLSHKQWKKIKRKQKRQQTALLKQEPQENADTDEDEERIRAAVEAENRRQEEIWRLRDRLGHQLWLEKQEREERERVRKEETERKIREEWEEQRRKEKAENEEKEKAEAEKKDKQDSLLKKATENEHKEWHNPLAPRSFTVSSSEEKSREINQCPFFTKTGACRFGDRCSRVHFRPESSNVILIRNMFENFELLKSIIDDYDTDINLEYEDSDLYQSFREFYEDVLPEFKSVGKIINFKVCCNHEAHLRGNVYVQYKRHDDAYKAFVKFNARWYGGRQITCEFVNIAKWKLAICGLFFVKRCPKGKNCNFLHVFRNPRNEFWEADQDFENSAHRGSRDMTPRWHHRNDRHGRRSRRGSRSRSRSRSRTRDSSRSYSHRRKRSREKSGSPFSRSHFSRKLETRENSRSRQRTRDSEMRFSHRSRSRSVSHSPNNGALEKKNDHSDSKSHSSSPKTPENHLSYAKERKSSVSRSPSNTEASGASSKKVRKSKLRSQSAERDSEGHAGKKHKHSKHKKSKKLGKKKKKSSKERVSLDHLAEGNSSEVELNQVVDGITSEIENNAMASPPADNVYTDGVNQKQA